MKEGFEIGKQKRLKKKQKIINKTLFKWIMWGEEIQ
jgi:hypothetical protein